MELGIGQFFMELVTRRDANTLVPVIQHHIRPGTRTWSDEWAAYAGLNQVDYIHDTVSHAIQYVDSVTGIHTNNIEAHWSACKASFRRHWGVARHHLPAYPQHTLANTCGGETSMSRYISGHRGCHLLPVSSVTSCGRCTVNRL